METLVYPYEKYFSVNDLMAAGAWLILLSLVAAYFSLRQQTKRDSLLYLFNFGIKLLFSLVFSLSYILIYNGGDTLAYWDGALSIQQLFSKSPSMWFEHITSVPNEVHYHTFFDAQTGYPPIWIYREPESYFISKMTSLFVFISFKSYLAVTIIFSFIVAHINWKLYQLAQTTNLFNTRLLPIVLLCIPSVYFWCSGISKDTFILSGILLLFYSLYHLFYPVRNRRFWLHLMLTLLSLWILYATRGFLVGIILVCLLVALYSRFIRTAVKNSTSRIIYRIGFYSALILSFFFFLSDTLNDVIRSSEYVQQAVVIQQDFQNNQQYGRNQYTLGEIELSPIGLIAAFPLATISGMFEPLPWNALSPSLMINGLESLFFILLVARLFYKRSVYAWIRRIRSHEALLFLLMFVLLLAYVAGFTSIIYGVLVRIRAPLLPFLGMLLILRLYTLPKPINQRN